MPNDNIPIEGYPSEYIEFFKQAAVNGKKVWYTTDLETTSDKPKTARTKCFVVRARMNTLRARMKKERHPLYDRIAKVSMVIEGLDGHNCHGAKGQICPDPLGSHCVHGRMRDSDLLGAFHDAGITAESLTVDPLLGEAE